MAKAEPNTCTIEIPFALKVVQDKTKSENELLWYDKSDNTINVFKGGRLNLCKTEVRKGFKKINLTKAFKRIGTTLIDTSGYEGEIEQEGKLVPVIVDEFSCKNRIVADRTTTEKFLLSYMNYNDSSLEVIGTDEEGIKVMFSNLNLKKLEKEIEDFTHNLERDRLRYTIVDWSKAHEISKDRREDLSTSNQE